MHVRIRQVRILFCDIYQRCQVPLISDNILALELFNVKKKYNLYSAEEKTNLKKLSFLDLWLIVNSGCWKNINSPQEVAHLWKYAGHKFYKLHVCLRVFWNTVACYITVCCHQEARNRIHPRVLARRTSYSKLSFHWSTSCFTGPCIKRQWTILVITKNSYYHKTFLDYE